MKTNSFKTDFHILKTNEALVHQQKIFIKVSILYYFEQQPDIRIKIDIFDYAIYDVFGTLTLGQSFSDYVTNKNLDFNSFKFKIGL